MKFHLAVLSLFLCYASIAANRVAPTRRPASVLLVDQRKGFSPLYQSSDQSKRRSGTYIIKLKDTTKFDDLGRIMAKLTDQDQDPKDDAVVQGLSGYSMVGLGVMASLNKKALDSVRQDTSVDYVEEDQVVEISAEPWHRDRVDQKKLPLNKKFCPPNDGEGVDIYILDTGVNYCHEDFCLNRSKFAGYSPVVSPTNPSNDGQDCHGHGTHVAALAAGSIHGVARKARIYSLPVLDCRGRGSNINIILALNHVVQRAIANPERRTIISMSLTAPLSTAVNEAIDRVSQPDELPQGILVVTAAGNYQRDACEYSPASSETAVTVGGSASDDSLYWGIFDGTNYGRCVDIFAPGEDVVSAGFPSCTGEATKSGTSMATPIVAGAAAIIWTANMSLTQAEVKKKLISGSTEDVLKLSQLTNSQGLVTKNRLVKVKYLKRRCNKFKHSCEPIDVELCGKPWDCPTTTLVTSVNIKELQKVLIQYRSKKMIPLYISPYVKGGEVYFAIIFKPITNVKNYKFVIGLGATATKKKVRAWNSKRFYEEFATSYSQNRKIYFIVVLRRMATRPELKSHLAQSVARYRATSKSYSGFAVVSMALTRNAKRRLIYTTLYEKSDVKTIVMCDLTFKLLLKRVNEQKNNGFTLKSVDTYKVKDETRFCAVFTNEKIGECEYIFVHSYSEKDIKDIAESHKKDGYHIVIIVVHSQRSFPLFMAVFKK